MPPDAVGTGRPAAPHILMVSHYFEGHRGGIEIVAGRLARELARLGLGVTWAATGDAGAPVPEVAAVPLRAWNVSERRLGIPFPLLSPGAIRRLWAACSRADAVIVHDSLYLTSVFALVAARLRRIPVMVIQHIGAVEYRNPVLRTIMRAANRLVAHPVLRSADQVVFISETTRAHFSLPATVRAETIFNGVDESIFHPAASPAEGNDARDALGIPRDAKVALFVGRFVEKKGLHWLRRLAEAHPELLWVFAGWGPIDPESWGMANVRVFRDLAGERLADLYRASDLFVLPSKGEGFPLVVQEALASGVPVVCGEETAAADPSATALLSGVPLRAQDEDATVRALSEVIVRKLAEAPDRDRLQRFARERYSWRAAARRYLDLLQPMIASRSSSFRPTEAKQRHGC